MQTRLRKLQEGECDGTLLALAGLKRLDLADKATAILSTGGLTFGIPALLLCEAWVHSSAGRAASRPSKQAPAPRLNPPRPAPPLPRF